MIRAKMRINSLRGSAMFSIKRLRSLAMDRSGFASIGFGLLALPCIFAIGCAIDYGRLISTKSQLQVAVDAAALAGASFMPPVGSSTSQNAHFSARKDRALQYLGANLRHIRHGQNPVYDIQPADSDAAVLVTAEAQVDMTFAALIIPHATVSTQAKARILGTQAPLCILALNAQADGAFKAWGTADLLADECAVFSNSNSTAGMMVGGSATAKAAGFCTVGGYQGTAYDPIPIENCLPLRDPHRGKYTVQALAAKGIDVAGPCDHFGTVRVGRHDNIVIDAGGPDQVMTFCSGIKVASGGTVTFKPGIYAMYNVFDVMAGATLNAPEGVTFYIGNGDDTADRRYSGVLTVQAGANFNVVAPQAGHLAGMALISPTTSGYTGATTPAETHTIIGGGIIDIVGSLYFPQSKIRITGNGELNANSRYFSLVADFVELEGNGQLYVKAGADAAVAGMPGAPIVGFGGGSSLAF